MGLTFPNVHNAPCAQFFERNKKMTDLQKTIVTFCAAVVASFILTLPVKIFFTNPFVFLFIFVLVLAYVLVAGYNRNGPTERSVGTFLGTLVNWTLPCGISWWIPRPFGGVTAKNSIQNLKLDRREGHALTNVLTRDGATIGVSFYTIYKIKDFYTYALMEAPEEALSALMERSVRWFATCWDSTGEHSIALQKKTFSDYLSGKSACKPGDPEGECSEKSDIHKKAKAFGLRVITSMVDDIDPPKSIVEANENKIIEDAEAEKEQRNMDSLTKRIAELKAVCPDLSDEAALRATQIEKGSTTSFYVDGNAGDFTKAAALQKGR